MVYAPTPVILQHFWKTQVEKFLANLQTYIALLSFLGGIVLAANSFYTNLRSDINTLKLNQSDLESEVEELKQVITHNTSRRDADIDEIQRDIKDILREQNANSSN